MRDNYLKIYWEIEEVIFVLVILIDLCKKHFLSVLVWDVLNHDGGATVLVTKDTV